MSTSPVVKFLRLNPKDDSDIPLPTYMSSSASGMDISAAVENTLGLEPGQIALIPTGFAMALPTGYEAQIRPRSGLAINHGISIINSPGTIDADYRGEVKIGLINLGKQLFHIKRGDRIAQMVIQRVYQADCLEVDELTETHRDTGGFGSTGV